MYSLKKECWDNSWTLFLQVLVNTPIC